MTQPATPRPFGFDTEFGADGQIVRQTEWQPPKRSYSPAEVEAMIAQARLEARQQALSEVEALRADALSVVAQTVASAANALGQIAEQHRQQSAELAVACGRALSGAAFDLFPRRPLEVTLEQLAQEIDASPRLLIRAPQLDAEARAQIEQLCVQSGFSGMVVFRDEAGAPASFVLEWADGRASFDPAEAETRLRDALQVALAAEDRSTPQTFPNGSDF